MLVQLNKVHKNIPMFQWLKPESALRYGKGTEVSNYIVIYRLNLRKFF